MKQVTIFKNFNEAIEVLPIEEIISRIKSGVYRKQVEQLRILVAEGKKKDYTEKKKSLTAFTPCGTFSNGRKIETISAYSGMLVLDIDKLNAQELAIAREKAGNEKYSYAMFLSPGGNGLKIIVQVNTGREHHPAAFNQVKAHYESILGIPVDKSGRDVSRLCFVSYDAEALLKLDAKPFPVNTNLSLEKDIQKVTEQVEAARLDMTSDYNNWRDIGFALCDALGESGRGYFHRISRFNPEYNSEICNEQYTKCLQGTGSGIKIRTLFFMAKNQGIDITPVEKKYPEMFDQKPAEEKTEKQTKIPYNKFQLAKKYLEKHYEIRYNEVSTQFEYREKGTVEYQPLNENSIFIKMQLDGLNLSLNNLVAFLKSDFVSRYNPFLEYFESLPVWDKKVDYIRLLASFVKVSNEDRNRFDNHFRKWLVRTIKCALIDDYFNKQAFILVHDQQNSGKSTFCRFLCPPRLRNYIAENLSVDKDSRILLTTNMIINLDELSTLSRVEINALKSLFSKDKINDRLPYDRRNSIIPRRASFIGSTNQTEFLNDESGSVRWLCFIINEITWSYREKVNMDNVYSQAYFLYNKSDFTCDLSPEEIAENEAYNRQFHIVTSEKELIEKYLEPATEANHTKFMTATEILIHLAEKTDNKVRLNAVQIGKSLKLLGFVRDRTGKNRNFGYYVSEKITENTD
ncbi:MAG: BT4734/BF3469 family protein [Bacteroidota bacterium]